MHKANNLWIWFLLGIFIGTPAFSMSPNMSSDKKDSLSRVVSQESLMREGRLLIDQGEYEKAFKKYEEASNPVYIKHEYERRSPIYGMMRACVMLKDYKKAAEVFRWVYDNSPNDERVQIRQYELDALIEWQKIGSKDLVYKVIEKIKLTFADQMPPLNYVGWGPSAVSTILRLYDTIGDHDAGIAYLNEVLSFLKERRKAKGDDLYVLYDLKSSKEADACLNAERGAKRRACKVIKDFLLVREAFEQDKAEGKKGCVGKKRGELCLGRATKALIQSDYFPW